MEATKKTTEVMAAPIYIPTERAQGVPSLHTLDNTS